jgi:hypothetical protein
LAGLCAVAGRWSLFAFPDSVIWTTETIEMIETIETAEITETAGTQPRF